MRFRRESVCTAWMPASRLSTYIVCRSGWSKPVWYFSATSSTWYSCVANFSGSSFSRMPRFMPLFGVGRVRQLVVLHGAGEGHKRLDGIALLLDVAVEALLVAHGFQARAGHDHRLGPAADLVPGDGLEVLDHDLGLLRDVVRVQPHEARQRLRRLLALDVRVVFAGLEQFEVGRVGRVVLQHVEDEPFLDGLAHRVAVERARRRARTRQSVLCLGVAVKAKKLRFACRPRLAMLRNSSSMSSRPSSAARFFASSRRSSPPSTSLRSVAVSPPCELWASSMMTAQRRVGSVPGAGCAPLLGHLEQLAGDERKLLQRGDDDRHRVLQRLGQLARAFVDLLHHAALVLELVDGVLQLLVEHDAVGDDDHAIEDALVGGVVQGREPVRQPADGVALAAAGRVLDQVVVPHAFAPGGIHQHAHRLELVVAREDHRLRSSPCGPGRRASPRSAGG